jgi:hypothetical protein
MRAAQDGKTINDLMDLMAGSWKALFDDKQFFCLRNGKSSILLVMKCMVAVFASHKRNRGIATSRLGHLLFWDDVPGLSLNWCGIAPGYFL